MTITEQAQAFDAANPHVYEKVVEIAKQIRMKKTRYGIMAVFNRLRWISEFETVGDLYKLNNNYTPWYARKVMAEHPDLRGLFQLRRSRCDAEMRAA